ncbi:MAG: MiaB/RimO family radical SAM methylthiotransferase [Phycisphaerae bacterium]|nr:MiaB/RimO family radical SAM methylthiotransferase [Phycisphaerae bacterium]
MATVYLETFGCQMNELDSELVRSQLRSLGHRFVDEWRSAEVVLFNTCSVREHAESKAYSRLGWIGQRKKRGEPVVLGVLGCMAERDGPDLLRRYPQVDLMCGPGELDRLPLLIDNALRCGFESREERVALAGDRSRRSAVLAAAEDRLEMLDLGRAFDPDAREGQAWSAYVRITRGCNKFCTYCVVPRTRGAEVHRPPDHIVEECRRLVDAGAIEITLLGQTVNHYRYTHGVSFDDAGREAPQIGPGLSAFRSGSPAGPETTTFARLLERIHDEVPGLLRLRFVTSYPRDFGDDVFEALASRPRLCPYVHAPVQSGSDRILRLMNRGYTVEQYRAFTERLFDRVPNATLAGDFIVGFPTETEEDFEASLELIRTVPFKNNFIFKYSPRPGTVAIERFEDDVPIETKKLRNNRMLAEQARTSRRVHESWVGRTVDVLVERVEDESAPEEGERVGAEFEMDGGGLRLAVIGAGAGAGAGSGLRGSAATVRRRGTAPAAALRITGRTAGDLIVSAGVSVEVAARPSAGPATASMAAIDAISPGRIVQVRLDSAEPLLLRGTIVGERRDGAWRERS